MGDGARLRVEPHAPGSRLSKNSASPALRNAIPRTFVTIARSLQSFPDLRFRCWWLLGAHWPISPRTGEVRSSNLLWSTREFPGQKAFQERAQSASPARVRI